MSHCITEYDDGVWWRPALAWRLGTQGRAILATRSGGRSADYSGVSPIQTASIFSLIHTINIESAVPAPHPNIVSSSQLDWSQVCSAEACSPAVVAS